MSRSRSEGPLEPREQIVLNLDYAIALTRFNGLRNRALRLFFFSLPAGESRFSGRLEINDTVSFGEHNPALYNYTELARGPWDGFPVAGENVVQ